MYKNLNATVLGVSGRQSELIELAMTYGFRGLDIDIVDLVKRTQRSEFDKASRYLLSSKMYVSGFDVPIDLDADDASFEKTLAALPTTIEIAGKVGARAGFLRLPAATDRLPFHEYFDVMRKRVDKIGEIFEKNNVMIGLYFSTAQENRENRQFKFVQDVESFLAFFKACTSPSVGIIVDSFNWVVGGGTFEQLETIPGNKIAALRLADAEALPSINDASVKMRQTAGTTGVGCPDRARRPSHFLFQIACNFNGSARLLPSLMRKCLGRSLALPIPPERFVGFKSETASLTRPDTALES
jgi:sugar phosphate isomerase/epimerase